MKKIVFKALFPILCIISILLGCCSFSASAYVDFVYNFNIEEPCSDSLSGYVIQPFMDSDRSTIAYIYFWTITPNNSNTSTEVPVSSYTYNSSSKTATLSFSTGNQTDSYLVSLWVSTSSNSNVRLIESKNISYSSVLSFTIRPGSFDYFLTPKFKNLSLGDTLPTGRTETYYYTFNTGSVIYYELINTYNKLIEVCYSLDLSNDKLTELIELLNDILADTDNISKKMNSIYNYLSITLDQDIKQMLGWESWFESFDYYLSLLVEYLMGPEEGFTQSPTLPPNQDEYNKVEDELLNNEDASDAQNSIDIQINENAMSYIWDLITQFLQANSKVFGLFISVLSLGIIALILNR